MPTLKLHPAWRCPCGTEWGDMTDHGQGEKLCSAHVGQDGYRGGVPQYVKGKAFPEGFADFVEDQESKGVVMPKEAHDFANKTRGTTDEPPPEPVVEPKKSVADIPLTVKDVKEITEFMRTNAISHKVHTARPLPKPAKKLPPKPAPKKAEKVKKKK